MLTRRQFADRYDYINTFTGLVSRIIYRITPAYTYCLDRDKDIYMGNGQIT